MRHNSQDGQASVEHVGLTLLVALALVGIAAAAGARPGSELPSALARALVPGAGPGIPGPTFETAGSERATPQTVVNGLTGAPLEDFLAYRSSPERDPRLDYSTDECTAPLLGNAGPAYDFTEACLRHDFGYRNLGRLGSLDGQARRGVDARFLQDMRAHCLARPQDEVLSCLEWARAYHLAVRAFGWIPAARYG